MQIFLVAIVLVLAGRGFVLSHSFVSAEKRVVLPNGLEKLVAGTLQANGKFGFAVALSSDGTAVLVGAYNSDAAYVFMRESVVSATWSQANLVADDLEASSFFGISVSLSNNGLVALVGAYFKDEGTFDNAGAVYVFSRVSSSSTAWSQQAKLLASDLESGAEFGRTVSISNDNTVVLVGANGKDEDGLADAGAAYVFSRTSASSPTWSQEAKLLASDLEEGARFGTSVSLSYDGTVALSGAVLKNEGGFVDAGAVYSFKRSSNSSTPWSQTKLVSDELRSSAWFGESISLSSTGKLALLGSRQNKAYLFTMDESSTWSLQQTLTGTGSFGISVALSHAGTLALVGAHRKSEGGVGSAGAVYLFKRESTSPISFLQQAIITAGNGIDIEPFANFGEGVALSGDGSVALVGASDKNEGGLTGAGAAYPVCVEFPNLSLDQCVPPTPAPTSSPTTAPTLQPSSSPTANPTTAPTASPTASPTTAPTFRPTAAAPLTISTPIVNLTKKYSPWISPQEQSPDQESNPTILVVLGVASTFIIALILVVTFFMRRWRLRSKKNPPPTGRTASPGVAMSSVTSSHGHGTSSRSVHKENTTASQRSRSGSKSSRRQSRSFVHKGDNRHQSDSVYDSTQSAEFQIPSPPIPIYSRSPQYFPAPAASSPPYAPATPFSSESHRVGSSGYDRSPGMTGVYHNITDETGENNSRYGRPPGGTGVYGRTSNMKNNPSDNQSGYGMSPGGAGVYQKATEVVQEASDGYSQLVTATPFSSESNRATSGYGRSPGMTGVYGRPLTGTGEYKSTTYMKNNPSNNQSGYGMSPGGAGVYQKAAEVLQDKASDGYSQLDIKWTCTNCKNVNLPQTFECANCDRSIQSY